MGRAGIVILPEFLAAVTPHWPDGLVLLSVSVMNSRRFN